MINSVICHVEPTDKIKTRIIETGVICIQLGKAANGASFTIDRERIPELIAELRLVAPEPEIEKIRAKRYITVLSDIPVDALLLKRIIADVEGK